MKLWVWTVTVLASPISICGFMLISLFPNQLVKKERLREDGAKVVRIGDEVWVVMVDESDHRFGQLHGSCARPAPMFRPADGYEAFCIARRQCLGPLMGMKLFALQGHIYAFTLRDGLRISWREIPIFSTYKTKFYFLLRKPKTQADLVFMHGEEKIIAGPLWLCHPDHSLSLNCVQGLYLTLMSYGS